MLLSVTTSMLFPEHVVKDVSSGKENIRVTLQPKGAQINN